MQSNNLKPSVSTVVSVGVGVPAAIFVAWVLQAAFNVEMPAEASTALGALISAAIGYFGHGGTSDETV